MSRSEENVSDVELLSSLRARHQELLAAIGEVVVGQKEVVELLLIALLADGPCLFVGVPGLAKTLLVHTVADAVGLGFNRVQFTPDLMPSDITGVEIIEEDPDTRRRSFRFVPGPVFTNLLLADEINRTPPKTQAALLQAMQERAVTAAGRTHQLARPFLVFATQNPIEQEGTYPLPEAQQDRFMFSVHVGYPNEEEEVAIVRRTTSGELGRARRVVSGDELAAWQRAVRAMPDHGDCVELAVRLARRSRPGAGGVADRWIRWGAGPRASQYMVLGAKARAALHGQLSPHNDDVRAVAPAVLRHRIVLNFEAEAAGVTVERVIDELLAETLRG